MSFIGRDKELKKLQDAIADAKPSISILYGRRRIGKSELIKQALKAKKYIRIEGIEGRSKREQIENFYFQLTKVFPHFSALDKKNNWKDALYGLFECVEREPCTIVLDEFQWIAGYKSELVVTLKMIWEQYLSKVPGVSLILCGSIASFMIGSVIKSKAFYGRIDTIIHLKPFTLSETRQFLPHCGENELLEAYMFTGGVPKYLELLAASPSIRLGMQNIAFTETGYYVDEYDRIFVSHFAKNDLYPRIIELLAEKEYGLSRKQIAEGINSKSGGQLSMLLSNMVDAGFISEWISFDRDIDTKDKKYTLTDGFMRFYFAFIRPNLKYIKQGSTESLFNQITQTGYYYNWLGKSYEYMCEYHARTIAHILEFSGIRYTYGPFFRPRNKEIAGIQIDLAFFRDDMVITLCEMKHQKASVNRSIIESVEKKVAVLNHYFPKHTIQRVLITNSDVSKELESENYFYRIISLMECV